MFSEHDVREIVQLLSPEIITSDTVEKLPSLVASSGGNGLRTGTTLARDFKSLLEEGPNFIPIASASARLGVDVDIVLDLAHRNPHLALLSENDLAIISTQQRAWIEERLHELLGYGPVSKVAFARDNNVSSASFDWLASSAKSGKELVQVGGYLLTKEYEETLSNLLMDKLRHSLDDVEPVEISTWLLPGTPPAWYIREKARDLLTATDMLQHFYVEERADSTWYTPWESLRRKRDAKISSLQSGTVACLDPQDLEFKVLYPSIKEVEAHFSTIPCVFLYNSFAISEKWISAFANKALQELQDRGYFECHALLGVPLDLQEIVSSRVSQELIDLYSQTVNDKIRKMGNFIITLDRYTQTRELMFSIAKNQASRQWQILRENKSGDIKFQVGEVVTLPSILRLEQAVVLEKGFETDADEQFWNQISDLELSNEADFSTFWIERVLARVHTYDAALDAVEDTKLRDQLADLRSTFLRKELLPDALLKARAQGLVLSRRTRKNIQKLETVLQTHQSDTTGTLSFMDKFCSKQGIDDPDATLLGKTKKTLISDNVRRMNKSKTDGPTLFLTLTIILFAREYPGVIYATGKYAPKLLKQLKSKLGSEAYEQLEKWKELAKTNNLTVEDKEAMAQMSAGM